MGDVWKNNKILIKADELAHEIYRVTQTFPKEEQYGITSQIRRAALSVPLNMIEGYSRFKSKSHIHYLEISFGSLKETHYLIEFCQQEGYISSNEAERLLNLCVEVEKMLYSKLKTMKSK